MQKSNLKIKRLIPHGENQAVLGVFFLTLLCWFDIDSTEFASTKNNGKLFDIMSILQIYFNNLQRFSRSFKIFLMCPTSWLFVGSLFPAWAAAAGHPPHFNLVTLAGYFSCGPNPTKSNEIQINATRSQTRPEFCWSMDLVGFRWISLDFVGFRWISTETAWSRNARTQDRCPQAIYPDLGSFGAPPWKSNEIQRNPNSTSSGQPYWEPRYPDLT